MTDLPAPDPFDGHAEPEVLTEALFGHRSWLRRLARALVRDDASADDLVQDAFGAAISAGGRVRNLRAFLSGTVRRRSLELRRNEARRRAREIDSSGDGPSAFPGADVAAERVETLRILLEELQLLPAAQRDALTMRFVEGLEPAEIARRADMAASTVRAHIARGLATLRERLDRRGGGRKSWSLALSPWAVLSAPDVAGETLAASSTSSAVPLGATGAIGSSGVALMTWKATAAVVPLALLGLWFGLDRGGDEGLTRTATRNAQEDDGTQTLANVATTEVERRAMLEAEPTSGRAASVEASIADITAPSVDDGSVLVTGSAVDILTGEPVPSIRLTVRSSRYTLPAGHPDVPNASDVSDAAEVSEEPTSTVLSAPASTSASQPPGVEVVTESDGTFTSEDTLLPGTVFVTENDSTDKWPGDTHFAQNSLPFTDPLPVHVGPTFRLVSAVPPGIPWDELRGRFAIGVDRGRSGMRAMVRGNDAPWIRLPYDVTRLGGDGPWTLELSDPGGLWLAEAEVTRKKGVEPHPVAMEFRSLGALEFVATCKPGALAPTGAVELVSKSGAAVRRVYMDVA